MQRVIGVKFKSAGKVFYFSPCKEVVEKGDRVLVDTEEGQEFGVVDFVNDLDEKDIPHKLKPVIRKATKDDDRKIEENKRKQPEYKKVVEEKIKQLKLDMKVVNLEISTGGNRVLVEFVADDRVDFRDLLKQLASTFKARIELKQIGQRDEVKEKGALGICGQVCCCKRFLKDFEHVSIKMAKNQNLSLNPTKISGVCGKLLCCLAYENDVYADAIKNMPKINQEVKTEDGVGKVIYNDVLKSMVSVKLPTKDNFEIKTYPLSKVEFHKSIKNNDEGE